MVGKYNFFMWNGVIVDRLKGLSWCFCETPEVGTSVQVGTDLFVSLIIII